jgi:Outer membrane protein beta-barrel domain
MRASHVAALAIASGLAFGSPAAAQIPLSLDLGGGPSFQFGQLKTNTATPGFNALVAAHYHQPFVPFSVRVEGLYDEYDHTSNYLGARQIWAISGNALYSFPSVPPGIVPYVLAGGGYYHTSENLRVDAKPPQTVPTVTASHFGLDGGAGVRYRLFGIGPGIGIGIFAEARYLYYFGPHANASMLPVIFGVSFPSVTSSTQ